MPEQDKILGSRNLLLKQIIDLSENLASISTLQSQKSYLSDFIRDQFGAQLFIRLSDPPKSLGGIFSENEFPFDSGTELTGQVVDIPIIKQIAVDGSFWVILPLRCGNNNFGQFIIKNKNTFESETIEALIEISKIAGMATFAALQVHLQNWRTKQLELVRSVTAQISQITDLETLTQQITSLIQSTFDYYYVAVFLINPKTKKLHFKASAGSDKSQRPEFEQPTHAGFMLGEHMIGYVAKTGQELIANNVQEQPRYKAVDSLADTKSEVVIPLKVETTTLGVFDIQSNEMGAFDENDLLVLRALADNIAIAIESTRLYQGVQTHAEQLSTVSEVSRAITTILDIDELLQRIVSIIHERFDFPFVHLYLVDPVQHKITFKAGSGLRSSSYANAAIAFDIKAGQGIIPWVVQNGHTKRINQVSQDPLFVKSPVVESTIGSEMAIPLFFGGEIMGVLDIQSPEENAFDVEDQQLIETLAGNIAIAIRNARLYRSEKWRRQISESLRDVAGLLSEQISQADILDSILFQLHKNLPCDVAAIWLFSPEPIDDKPIESQELYLAAYNTAEGYSSDDLAHISFFPDEWVKTTLTQSIPTIRQPQDSLGPIAKIFNLEPHYSSIAAPLHAGGETLGMLTLVHHEPGRYGEESQKITPAFASYAAIAIKNTRLYATSQEQAWISTILLQVAQATQSLTDLNELVSTIVRLTPMVVGIKGCALFLREPESKFFSLYAMYGIGDLSDDLLLQKPRLLMDAPILDELMITREPLKVQQPKDDFGLPDHFTDQMSKDTLLLVPLISRNEVLGAFLLANETEGNRENNNRNTISGERLNIIQGIIQQTAVAIENIRLLEEKQEEAYVSTVLLQVAQAAVNSANLEDTLNSIVHIMPILVGIDTSVIYVWNAADQTFLTTQAATNGSKDEKELIGTTYTSGEFPMLDVVFRNNRPIVHPFVENELPPEDWDLALPDEGQIDPTPVLKSHFPLLMGFPLSVKDEVFGVLLAQDKNLSSNQARRFELLWGIAQQASLAIQNDRLNKEMLDRQHLEREFQLAREIQQTFLPDQVPEIPGWEMVVHWETARQVGGDFYDYFLLPDGRLAFIIADVSDKGLAASLYMTVTRTLLRAAALEYDSPAKALERVNDLLLRNSQNGLFVTTFYGALSLEDGALTYCIAGHNPPMVIRHTTNEVVEFTKGGIALGALPDIHLEQKQVFLNHRDCLVLYTDGVTEAFNSQDQMYGEARLKKVLEANAGSNARDVLAALEEDLETFRANAPLSDDTTILAICRS